ncbi:HupE/UreJ family protein [Rhodobacteraceae bacterium CY05]|uniref:HupE/UreJ family protein n=2 Tax=Parasedimentitalea huanghaiensis TaxID=2682100 RepID=A0A6L6WA34_9RHOB|nr:HupE/UreJ family protein [Zongyanglinia huanghaiensis]
MTLLRISHRLASVFLMSSLALFALVSTARAHEVTPTIADFRVENDQIAFDLRLNIEAFVAGINLDGMNDTNDAAQATDYDSLRALDQAELEPMVRQFAEEWLETLELTATGSVQLSVTEVVIPEVGNVDLPRATYLLLNGSIPSSARSLTMTWPKGSGSVVLRQNGVDEPYTGFLQGGETTPPIPLTGGAALTPLEAFVDYLPVGFEHILPRGLDHILFVLGLFFLSSRLRPLIWQVSAFTLAHTITLALGALGVVTVSPDIVEPLIAASIVYVAVENIFTRHLSPWRPLVIFGFGLLHGLGFASVLGEFGLPRDQFIAALVGFNVGVELGQLYVIAVAFAVVGVWFRSHPKYRGRIAIPASITIAVIGAYWFVERMFL